MSDKSDKSITSVTADEQQRNAARREAPRRHIATIAAAPAGAHILINGTRATEIREFADPKASPDPYERLGLKYRVPELDQRDDKGNVVAITECFTKWSDVTSVEVVMPTAESEPAAAVTEPAP